MFLIFYNAHSSRFYRIFFILLSLLRNFLWIRIYKKVSIRIGGRFTRRKPRTLFFFFLFFLHIHTRIQTYKCTCTHTRAHSLLLPFFWIYIYTCIYICIYFSLHICHFITHSKAAAWNPCDYDFKIENIIGNTFSLAFLLALIRYRYITCLRMKMSNFLISCASKNLSNF